MKTYTLPREELLALLKQAGAATAQGISDEFLPPLASGETLPDGDFNPEELALGQLLAHPHSVVHAIRFGVDNVVQEEAWFYVAGDQFASLTAVSNTYELSTIDSLETLFDKAASVLPLRPSSQTENLRVVLDREDFIDVRYLLTNWHKVSGEMVLEAAGMEKFEAVDLAHSISTQEWHGRLVFKFYQNDRLSAE